MKRTHAEVKNQRVVTFLNRGEVDFLDKIGKDALFSSGMKLSRAKLIAWLVDIIIGLDIDGEGLRTESDFEDRIKLILKRQIAFPLATDKPLRKYGGAR